MVASGWRASAEASFGIGESGQKNSDGGTGSAREALRPYGLFVSLYPSR